VKRHPFHAICPYFAMFPEAFVERQVRAYTAYGEATFDPFCGRGTTVFQSLLMGRPSAGTDVNPVAACIAGAKSDPPSLEQLLVRIDELEVAYDSAPFANPEEVSEFFQYCFAPRTLPQVLFLREILNWRTDRTDRFLAAVSLGALHGESHRSKLYFSNRMPRTISTKPEYSVRWWKERASNAPERNVFSILRQLARFRFQLQPAELIGTVAQMDARRAAEAVPEFRGRVKLVVTSPPYLDTTDYSEDQWLRLWFLGGADKPIRNQGADDRLVDPVRYWTFLQEAWGGVRELLAPDAIMVVRIGGKGLSREDLLLGLERTLQAALSGHNVRALDEGVTTAIKPRETTVFRPNRTSNSRVEHDFTFSLQHAA